MDGYTLLYSLKHLIEEDSSSGFWDSYLAYQFINEAAFDWAIKTKCLRAEQSITTVAEQSAYDLNPDYLGLYLMNSYKKYFLKYSDGTATSFITYSDYEDIIISNNITSQSFPSRFAIRDKATLPSRITSTATSSGASSGGESTLTDISSATKFSDVYTSDFVHNLTDGSTGVILSKTSNTALVAALFNGANNDWSLSDAYVIQPQGRKQLIVDPPSSSESHTITLFYLQKPAPVYSNYGMFRFDKEVNTALVKYAAWLYKYRDKDPNYGDKWFVYYENQIKNFNRIVNNTLKKPTWSFTLKAD